MRIFEDKDLTKEVKLLDFGIVEAGQTKNFEYWVENNSVAYMQALSFKVEHDEVKVTEAPTELPPFAKAKLIFTWSPSVTLKQGLKANLRIQGSELWS